MSLVAVILFALLAPTPVAAVRIPFTNCLPDSYQLNEPSLLQWVPLYADAVFDDKDGEHNLLVTVWGNVTGSTNKADLPAPGDPYWQDDDSKEGKIDRTPEQGQDRKATTLYRKVNVLTFEPWSEVIDFCSEGLTNYTCPLSPVFGSIDDM